MRKYFNSALLNAGCDSFHVEYWMGHQLDDTKAAYFRANIQQQKELYQKYIPYLTIQKELDISVSTEFKKAIERAEKAEAEVERVSVERDDFQRMKQELESSIDKKVNDAVYLQMMKDQLRRAQEQKKRHPELEELDRIIEQTEEKIQKYS